ncbi:MAG: OmpA family protein [Polyangiaceae bacterium]
MRLIFLPAVLLTAGLCMACEEGPKPPLKTAYSAAGDAQPGAPTGQWMNPAQSGPGADTRSPTAGSIQIDDRILKACGDIPTAHFAFDSAAIGGDAANALNALARCFVTGPLAGAGLRLIGHADPRGGVAYNIALGQQRAGSVATFLTEHGIREERMGTLSKGAFEATGIDEQGWAQDRKVMVYLAD